MHKDLLLDDLLSLENQAFLQGLYLLLHLVDIWISSLEVATAMHVQRVLELFRECFDL